MHGARQPISHHIYYIAPPRPICNAQKGPNAWRTPAYIPSCINTPQHEILSERRAQSGTRSERARYAQETLP